jgi:crossover junction endodeoxyribonuclease RuvC
VATILLGIDPGLTRCGFGLIEALPGRKVRHIEHGVIETLATMPLPERLAHIAVEFEKILDRSKPSSIGVERVFAQQNLHSVMGVAQVSGVVLMIASRRGIPISMHTPTEVKLAVTGTGRAIKSQVAKMVSKLLSLTEVPKPADAADALAIAIACAWRSPALASSEEHQSSDSGSSSRTAAQEKWQSAIEASKRKSKA